jgi:zinc protease
MIRSFAMRAQRRSSSLAAFLLAIGFLLAGPLPGQAVDVGLPRPQRSVLPNGVVLVVQEHRASQVVAIQLWMRVGGRDEAADELGLSHCLEHMLFKGTPTRPPGSIDQMIEGVGGQSNAFTSYDFTHFDVLLPAGEAAAGIELLADIAVNASFDQGELDRERLVILDEMRLVEDDPDRFLSRRLSELAYVPTPYGRPVLGTPKLIRDLTRERLARYYKKRYVPKNMTLVVVGAIDPATIQRLAAESFGRLPSRPAQRASMPGQPSPRGRKADVGRPEKQAYLGMAWRAPSVSGDDVFATDLLTYILGDSPSSRLSVSVRDRQGLVSEIEAGYITRQFGGHVTVTARLDPENLAPAEAAILAEIRRLATGGVTEAERQRAIVTAESHYAFAIETVEGLAETYGQAETTYSIEKELRYLARLREITAAQIQAAAQKYLRAGAYASVRFLPKGESR